MLHNFLIIILIYSSLQEIFVCFCTKQIISDKQEIVESTNGQSAGPIAYVSVSHHSNLLSCLLLQRFAMLIRQSGQLFCPFLIHCSMHSVWKMCFSSQWRVVTKSLRRKSLQQMGHCLHRPLTLSFKLLLFPLQLCFFLCWACLCLNLDLSSEEIISGTGSGMVSRPPNMPSMKRLCPSCSSACSISCWNCSRDMGSPPFSAPCLSSCSRSRLRII